MIKLQNTESLNPDGTCVLGILIASQALEDAGSELILISADSSGFDCVVFEANDNHVQSVTRSLGSGWTVTLGENDELTCEKV